MSSIKCATSSQLIIVYLGSVIHESQRISIEFVLYKYLTNSSSQEYVQLVVDNRLGGKLVVAL